MKRLRLLPLLLAACTLGARVQGRVYLREEFEDGGYNQTMLSKSSRGETVFEIRQVWIHLLDAKENECNTCFIALSLAINEMDGKADGWNLNIVQITVNFSSLQENFMETKKKIKINKDTHLYTLIIRPNATYEVKIDNKQVAAGDLEDDWDFLPPRKIKDPYARKPRKWDERLQIEDPEDKKPEDWEDFEYIPDPGAKKPEDWNEAMDGEWEGPLILNPKYKGQWKPRIIDNPNYQGEWIHPEIDNPKYKPDPTICHYYNISVLGLDLWQVKSGSIFDNFLLTNDEQFAEEVGDETWGIRKDIQKQWRELHEEMEKKKTGRRS